MSEEESLGDLWLQEELNVWHASSVHLCLTIHKNSLKFFLHKLTYQFQYKVELQILCLVQVDLLYLPQTEEGLKNGEETVNGRAPGF